MSKRVTWNGDFANERKSGTVVSEAGGNTRIQWDNGRIEIVPTSLISARYGWSRS